MSTSREIEKRLDRIEKKLNDLLKVGTTHVAVLQDKSGSMSGRQQDVISGFNEYIENLKNDENADKMRLTVTQFDTNYNVVHDDVSLSKVSKFNNDSYVVGGMTALYDAIGRTINNLKRVMKRDDRALVVIMTDGAENSSVEFNRKQITDLITGCQDEDNWTFVYLGADVDAFTGGTSIGIHGANTLTFDSYNHSGTYGSLSAATTGLTASPLRSSDTFIQDFYPQDEDKDTTSE